MTFSYNSIEELYGLISHISKKYYEPLSANIIYLEEYTHKNQVAFIIELRDAYSHLAMVFSVDNVLASDKKEIIQSHLSKYASHLERALLDSYIKIASIEYRYLMAILPRKDGIAIKPQIAQTIKDLRIMTLDNDTKITGYCALIKYIEDIRNQFTRKKGNK
jgi:hypothetical protein